MNFPEDAPGLPKLPFIAGDLVLIATAGLIAWRSATPLQPGPLLAITICVVGGAALAVVPYMANYARRRDAELNERQDQIAVLARTTAESAEQIGIVAAGLHGMADSSKHNLDLIAKIPERLQERIDGLTQQLATSVFASHTAIKDELAELKLISDKISAALAKAQTLAEPKAQPPPAGVPTPKPAAPSAPVAPAKPEALPEPTPTPEPEDVVVPPSDPDPATSPVSEKTTSTEAEDEASPPPEPAPAPKPPRTRKAKASDDAHLDLGLTSDEQGTTETSVANDGFTRLIATAYIGIGNKLFIRGEGPGLSWEKGVPLEFVSIGKWRWETPDATAPVSIKLYKNDLIECAGLGTLVLAPGHHHEVNAGF